LNDGECRRSGGHNRHAFCDDESSRIQYPEIDPCRLARERKENETQGNKKKKRRNLATGVSHRPTSNTQSTSKKAKEVDGSITKKDSLVLLHCLSSRNRTYTLSQQ